MRNCTEANGDTSRQLALWVQCAERHATEVQHARNMQGDTEIPVRRVPDEPDEGLCEALEKDRIVFRDAVNSQ